MKMSNNQAKKIILLTTGVLVVCFFAFSSSLSQKTIFFGNKFVLADDSEEDSNGEEKDKDFYEPKVETSSVQKSIYVKEVITKTTYVDSDRDGIFDNEDEHPTINDFFIVKDENNNGIVDKYENR